MLLILILSSVLNNCEGYNLNDKSQIILSDPYQRPGDRARYFGFSVSLYSSNFNDSKVVIGAPRANISMLPVKEPGTIFRCSLDNNCVEWLIDTTKNGFITRQFDQIRDYSWTGATIFIEDDKRPVTIICSPGWKIKVNTQVFVNGMCYYAIIDPNNPFRDSAVSSVRPLSDLRLQILQAWNGNNYAHYAMGQFGFSLNYYSSKNGAFEAVIGSPGLYDWHGSPVHLLGEKGYNYQNFVTGYTSESTYLVGYSVTSGFYFNENQRIFAASAPRSDTMKGKVLVYSYEKSPEKIIEMKMIRSSSTGEYFGYSLASCDVDNDRKDELIIGAPLWSSDGDEGRVYVYTSKDKNYLEVMTTMEGEKVDSRFGTSVMCLNDLDQDGFKDVAVGAPYEDDYGAVYIFNGNKNGLSSKWSQKISARSFGLNIRGFGISISEPKDIDDNGYYDIAVGAYLSGHVVLFKSHPVITINTNMTYLQFNYDSNSFSIEVCSFYHGLYVPNSLTFVQTFKIDSDYERAYLKDFHFDSGNKSYNLLQTFNVNMSTCQRHIIYIKNNINSLEPLKVSASLELKKPTGSTDFSYPVLNKNQSQVEDELEVSLLPLINHGKNAFSNVTLAVKSNLKDGNKYIIGSVDPLKLDIEVYNYGGNAYQTQVIISIPESVSLFMQPDNCKEYLLTNTVECGFGNPLDKPYAVTSLELNLNKIKSSQKQVPLKFVLTTQNKNLNENGSDYDLAINFEEEVDITVAGKAEKSVYVYSEENGVINVKNLSYQHIYEVRKFGLTPIKRTHLEILVPTHFINSIDSNRSEISRIGNIELTSSSSASTHNSNCYKKDAMDNSNYNENIIANISLANISPDLDFNQNIFHINCSNPLIKCTIISCDLEVSPDSPTSTVGKVTVNIDLILEHFYENITDGKEIIYFTSFGLVNIASPENVIQNPNNRTDFILIQTKLMNVTSAASKSVSIWVIVGSVVIGLLLLILLIFVLIKIGFFNRKKKVDLEKLKADEHAALE